MPGTYSESTRAKGFVAISTIPEYVYISFCAYRSLIAWSTVYGQHGKSGAAAASNVPAGSLRCERFVRSSLASSMAGFIKGGRFGSLPS